MSIESTSLTHYGVKGMKWGVKKSVYKSMTKQQKKATKKKYWDNVPTKELNKAAMIGQLIGGPIGSAIAVSRVGKKYNYPAKTATTKQKDVPKSTIKKGKATVDKFKNAKIETDEQKIMRLMKEGKTNPKARYTFDQNGNLFMVTWDD